MVDDLVREIAAVHEHRGDPDALHTALRRSVLVVAMVDDDAVATVADRGLHWMCGFTSTDALARFGRARGEGDRSWPFRTFRGAELLDRRIPATTARTGSPVGLAIDLAGTRPDAVPTRDHPLTAPDGYLASPAALTEAAAGVEDALTELRAIGSAGEAQVGRGTNHLAMGAASVGHAGLADALAGFCTTWEWCVRGLVQAGGKIVDGLNGTATDYQKAERAVEDVLKRVVFDSTADPHADPSTAAGMSWETLLAPQQPDYDGWQQTADHAGAIWTDVGRDVAENSGPGMIERALNGENPLQGQLDDLRGLSEIGD